MKFLSKIVCPILLCLAVLSCSKQGTERYSDGKIRVRVDSENTKAAVNTIDALETLGKFVMEAYVDRDVFNDAEGNSAHTRVGKAYFGPTSKMEENVLFEESTWNLYYWDPSKPSRISPYWVSSEGNMSFWSWVKPQGDLEIDRENSALYLTSSNVDESKGVKMLFDYSLPTPAAETDPGATSFDDASKQEDLVFAYWQDFLHPLEPVDPDAETPEYPGHQDVWVHFYHALAQIRFAFSTDDGSFENGLQIKSIAISDVASGGTCTFWGGLALNEFLRLKNDPTDEVPRDVASLFEWSSLEAAKAYRQDIGVTVDSGTLSYTGWNHSTFKKDSETKNLFTCQNVFMMIPQTLTSSSCVRLTVFDGSKPVGEQEKEFVAYLKPLGDEWEAGMYYTYKLNYQNNQITFTLERSDWGVIEGERVFNLAD